MVASSYIGLLVTGALAVKSSNLRRASQSDYITDTIDAVGVLQGYYDSSSGLWDGTGWWNSANCLTVLADFGLLDSSFSQSFNIPGIISTTYENAQNTYSGFINDYYDDEGWWALACRYSLLLFFLFVWRLITGDSTYLNEAISIFNDMENGGSPCGGIWWDKAHTYTNAIANELYLKVAASLANRVPSSDKDTYLNVAQAQWNVFQQDGYINSENLINDGLTSSCTNNGEQTWTYNQGVILGGLVELYKANRDTSLLTSASNIANAAISHLVQNGILYEGCEPSCGGDGEQFKGIFMRNLQELNAVAPSSTFSNFITANADAIWADDNSNYHLGVTWDGPYTTGDAATQSSALDALVAAVAVS
ncbi:glycoside hydrolase family 76 protein [Xylariaceae sp. FL0255]|nr:glycoside hydrolase family 76 protein [Xylariaceae sp. FL0255]